MELIVEHEIVGGKTVVETFEDVESFNNPPMTETFRIEYNDGSSDTLRYGRIVRGESE